MTDLSKFKVATAFQHLDPNEGLADGIGSGFSSIRYRGKQWTLKHAGNTYPFKREDDGTPLSYIDVVILGKSQGLSQVYFGNQGDWNEDSASGPICASLKGDKPDPGVSIPQSESCGICEHNEWITKPGGGRGKECQSYKRLAVLLMPAMTRKMLGAPLMEPVFLKIPPGSFASLKKFDDELRFEGIPFASVVTRVSFSSERLFEMIFTVTQALTNEEAKFVLPMREEPQTKQILGLVAGPRQIAAPQEKPAPAKRERVDTGLMEAFTAPEVEEPRPAPKPRRPKTIEAKVEPPEEAPKQDVAENETPWEESDSDLDDTVAKLMGDKLNKMLPK